MPPIRDCLATLDRRFFAWTGIWAVASLLAFGLVAAIIPNPIFGRQIPPEPFAIWIWLASAPLMGLVAATYTSPARVGRVAPLVGVHAVAGDPGATSRGTTVGSLASFGAFLAIGCPICNKIALLLLGTGGAMTIFAPIQPILGAVSLALLAGTLVWRLRLRTRGGACAV